MCFKAAVLAVASSCGVSVISPLQQESAGSEEHVQAAQNGAGLKDSIPPSFYFGGRFQNDNDTQWNDAAHARIAQDNFNAVTATTYPNLVVEPDGSYRYGGVDRMVAWAEARGMAVHGHVLVYPTLSTFSTRWNTLPDNQIESETYRFIDSTVERYRGRIWVWDVVNEALADSANEQEVDGEGLRTRYPAGNVQAGKRIREYAMMGGGDYLRRSFRRARAKDASVKLIINEYGVEYPGYKADNYLRLVKKMRDEGVPLDGVGFQFHLEVANNEPDYQAIDSNLKRFTDAGFKIYITELDIEAIASSTIQNAPTDVQLTRQKNAFREILKMALRNPNCESFLMWDFVDKYSWLHPKYDGKYTFPAPFDAAAQPKPAYVGLKEAFDSFTGTYWVANVWTNGGAANFLNHNGTQNSDGSWTPNSRTELLPFNANYQSEKWLFESVGGGTFRLKSAWGDATYLSRDAESVGGVGKPGRTVSVIALNPSWFSQQWQLERVSNGVYRLKNRWVGDNDYLVREGAQNASGGFDPGRFVALAPLNTAWQSQMWSLIRAP